MRFLLDTNVISEVRKTRRDPNVARWVRETAEEQCLSAVTIAELRFGIEKLASSEHRQALEQWLNTLFEKYRERILPIDIPVAEAWGHVMARSEGIGRKMAPMDCFLAATALVWDLTLVTRNVGDFAGFGGKVFSPWETI